MDLAGAEHKLTPWQNGSEYVSLEPPQNFTWGGEKEKVGVLSWGAVTNANVYSAQLYRDGGRSR